MKMKEVGSVFPLDTLEISPITRYTIDEFKDFLGLNDCVLFLSLGRESFSIIARNHPQVKRVLLPTYTCQTVCDPFVELGWDIDTYLIDKLTVHKHEVWNEALTFLGIDNSNVDKKERLITDEVRSNDELISYYLKCFYETRKQACDMINEKFLKDSDLKIELTLNKELMEELKSYMLPDEKDDIINKDSEAILNG